jgi:hypothetical protein
VTLIITTISNLGIVQASDSNLTAGSKFAGEGTKLFRLDFCSGAIALAGSYDIAGEPMSAWMPAAIADYAGMSFPTLGGFARYLEDRLDNEAGPDTGVLAHIAGYVVEGATSHPEMWFVRNYSGISDVDGAYTGRTDTFAISEDFWRRDYMDSGGASRTTGAPYRCRYFNGLPDGRISYNVLQQMLWSFFNFIWSNPEWQFRQPKTLKELGDIVSLELQIVSKLFEQSDYSAPYVGGAVQLELCPPPTKGPPQNNTRVVRSWCGVEP